MMVGAAYCKVGWLLGGWFGLLLSCDTKKVSVCGVVVSDYNRLASDLGGSKRFYGITLRLSISKCEVHSSRDFSRRSFLEEMGRDMGKPGSSYPSPRRCVRTFRKRTSRMCIIALSNGLDNSCGDTILTIGLCGRRRRSYNGRVCMFGSYSTSVNRALVNVGIRRLRRDKLSFSRIMGRARRCVTSVGAFFILRALSALEGTKQLDGLGTFITDALGVGPIVNSASRNSVRRLNRTENVGETLTGVMRSIITTAGSYRREVLTVSRYGYPRHTRCIGTYLRGLTEFGGVIVISATNVSDVCTGSKNVVVTMWKCNLCFVNQVCCGSNVKGLSCARILGGVRGAHHFNGRPKIIIATRIVGILERGKGRGHVVPCVRITNAGKGNSIYTFFSDVLGGRRVEMNAFMSPRLMSFRRHVAISKHVVPGRSIAQLKGCLLSVSFNVKLAVFSCYLTVTLLCFRRRRYSCVIVRAKLKNELSSAGTVNAPRYTIVAGVNCSRVTVLNDSVTSVTTRGTNVVGRGNAIIIRRRSGHTVRMVRRRTRGGRTEVVAIRRDSVTHYDNCTLELYNAFR